MNTRVLVFIAIGYQAIIDKENALHLETKYLLLTGLAFTIGKQMFGTLKQIVCYQ